MSLQRTYILQIFCRRRVFLRELLSPLPLSRSHESEEVRKDKVRADISLQLGPTRVDRFKQAVQAVVAHGIGDTADGEGLVAVAEAVIGADCLI